MTLKGLYDRCGKLLLKQTPSSPFTKLRVIVQDCLLSLKRFFPLAGFIVDHLSQSILVPVIGHIRFARSQVFHIKFRLIDMAKGQVVFPVFILSEGQLEMVVNMKSLACILSFEGQDFRLVQDVQGKLLGS